MLNLLSGNKPVKQFNNSDSKITVLSNLREVGNLLEIELESLHETIPVRSSYLRILAIRYQGARKDRLLLNMKVKS